MVTCDRLWFRPRFASFFASAFLLALLFSGGGCIGDDDTCGKRQVPVRGEALEQSFTVCKCDEAAGYVFDASRGYGCVRCKGDEVIKGGSCVVANLPDAGAGPETSGPTGMGVPCSSNADCAPFDAKLCDVVMTHACVLDRCATGDNICPMDSVCCDLSNLAEGVSVCVDEGQLESGNCPMGGTRVEP